MLAPRLKTRSQSATVSHPKFPSVVINIQRLGRRDLFDYYSANEANEEIVVVKDNGQVVLDGKGDVATRVRHHYSIENVLGLLRKVVTGWRGLIDEDGAEIAFSLDRVELLVDEALDFEEEKDGVKTVRLFWQYVFEKAIDPKQFGIDPNAAR